MHCDGHQSNAQPVWRGVALDDRFSAAVCFLLFRSAKAADSKPKPKPEAAAAAKSQSAAKQSEETGTGLGVAGSPAALRVPW